MRERACGAQERERENRREKERERERERARGREKELAIWNLVPSILIEYSGPDFAAGFGNPFFFRLISTKMSFTGFEHLRTYRAGSHMKIDLV